jgi:transposase InsO family protein
MSMEDDCTNPETGEITPLVIVSDNGSCYKSAEFTVFIEARKPWLYHVRTRFRSPWTNGVIERFFQTLKYEHLYREEITNGLQLGHEIATLRTLYNDVRPHENLDWQTPRATYLATPALEDPEQSIQLPGTGPPINYNPDPPRPRTRRPPGPPRPPRNLSS